MSLSKVYLNRRRDSRYACRNDRITWQRDANPRRTNGTLKDVSVSGLSYLTRRVNGLKIGDGIELTRRHNPDDRQHCRVVRISPTSDGRTLVACRRMNPMEVVTIHGPNPKLRTVRYVVRPKPSAKIAA